MTVATWADTKTGEGISRSLAGLADDLDLDRTSLVRTMGQLVDAGWFVVTYNGKAVRKPSRYRLAIPESARVDQHVAESNQHVAESNQHVAESNQHVAESNTISSIPTQLPLQEADSSLRSESAPTPTPYVIADAHIEAIEAETGAPTLKRDRVRHALAKEYVAPALDMGATVKQIEAALRDTRTVWPTRGQFQDALTVAMGGRKARRARPDAMRPATTTTSATLGRTRTW